ncbi:MAG: zinc ribbon domain-containing protein [Nitrosopumilus sp.]|nr:zinc ribbon domain-containing protein [Nitrosopumilus sp.]CAI9831467.1 Zinc-ribbon domain protein [Nitrosopumilaceae archaeon]MDA7941826.1 zinc ribbon domain-containing protein [Nitrosopumilus sp.]MDA7943033.1 zinc ribbon domain-containing protein [Nitrosopumilus sp.]MDA7945470.1 zinc ribbon domain-containing protein [Nitrosopumilus sp.]
MSLEGVDTLNLLFDKLQALFDESQGYYETFLDTNNMYKAGKLSDKEFFEKLGDYVVAYSALEFLAIKVMFEMRKAIGGPSTGMPSGMPAGMAAGMAAGMQPGTPLPGATPGMPPGMGPARAGTAANPVGGPPGIVSAKEAFGQVGTLPSPDPSLVPRQPQGGCASCGAQLRQGAKFCTSCGAKA